MQHGPETTLCLLNTPQTHGATESNSESLGTQYSYTLLSLGNCQDPGSLDFSLRCLGTSLCSPLDPDAVQWCWHTALETAMWTLRKGSWKAVMGLF